MATTHGPGLPLHDPPEVTANTDGPPGDHLAAAADAAVEFCSELVRFDTSNWGGGDARPERPAAEWVAERLTDAGYRPQVFEAAPGRASTVVRIPGHDPTLPALLVHAHLDVVPAQASDWSFDPFSGAVEDRRYGPAVLGRGALDMKDMAAMTLAVATSWTRRGLRPARDVVLAFVADEEDTGELGAEFLVREHPELFDGVRAAVGESGGGLTLLPDGSHLYAVGSGERGTAWMRLTARGPAGHGSRPHPDNAVTTLAETVAALARTRWPVRAVPTVATLLEGIAGRLGRPLDPADPDLLRHLGNAAGLVERTLANSLNPTMLAAGYKANVVPSEAVAHVDGRTLPGLEDEFLATVDALLPPSVTREFVNRSDPVAADHTGPEFTAIATAIRAHDPGALVLPFVLGGGTDAKAFTRLGIDCFGFVPARHPPEFPAAHLVHGVDEQVPVAGLRFGTGVLDTYLLSTPEPQEEP